MINSGKTNEIRKDLENMNIFKAHKNLNYDATDVISVRVSDLEAYVSQRVQFALDERSLQLQSDLQRELDAAKRRAEAMINTNRVKFARDNETLGESYSRNQGFKSGIITAQHLVTLQSSIQEEGDK